MKIAVLVLMVVVIALAVILFALVENVPPDALTITRMTVIENRIRDYAAVHQRLPDCLSELPKLPGNRDDSVVDGWGRPIEYEKDGDDVMLRSLGKDGRRGGDNQDADLKATFTVGTGRGRR